VPETAIGFDGVRIVGHGPHRIVVSHGWIADSSLFDPVLDHIDQDLYTLALFDHRGYGVRGGEKSEFNLETSATELLSIADDLGWETFSIIGHSMGALVAQLIAISHLARLYSMVLIAPVPASGALVSVEDRAERLHRVGDPSQRADMIRTNAAADEQLSAAITALSLRTTTTPALAGFLDSFGTADFGDRLSGCTVPTLIVLGESDPAVPAALIERTLVEWLPRSEIVTLPTGHYPMQQQPAQLWDSCHTFWTVPR